MCRITGKQVGPKTGDARTFKSFEDVIEAYKKQMFYAIKTLANWDNLIDRTHAELMPTPFTSIADGISPTTGMDVNGPTAVFKSVCTIDHYRCPNGVIFNQKVNPAVISTPEGMRKFIELIRTYIKMGGGHIQFNIVSADTLRDAQKNPEKHRGLVIRVAGYSAFFNEIHRDVQDSIIARTEQEL